MISLYEHWILVNKRIASAYERTLEESEALLTEIDKLKDEADNLERQLISRSSFFASMNSDYFFNDIVSRLNRNEIYVDIINVPSYDFDLHASLLYNKSYYAYVIQKNDTVPQLVYLGSASDFDNYHNYFSSYTKERPSNKEFSNGTDLTTLNKDRVIANTSNDGLMVFNKDKSVFIDRNGNFQSYSSQLNAPITVNKDFPLMIDGVHFIKRFSQQIAQPNK